jgi:hypothetical protein
MHTAGIYVFRDDGQDLLKKLQCVRETAMSGLFNTLFQRFHGGLEFFRRRVPEFDLYTISPDARKEVLKRLLKLNQEIHEQELKAGLHAKRKTKKKQKTDAPGQIKLF